jgi:hypothetical protein
MIMFFVLLLVWHGLYTAFDIDKQLEIGIPKCHFKYEVFQKIIIGVILMVYPIQITLSYLRAIRGIDGNSVNILLISLMGLILFFIIIFIVYSCKMRNILSGSYDSQHRNKNMRKCIYSKKTEDIQSVKNEEIKMFLKEAEERGNLNLIKNYILDDVGQAGINLDDTDIYYTDELMDQEMELEDYENKNGGNDIHMTNILSNREMTRTKSNKYHYSLKKSDINILHKVELSNLDFWSELFDRCCWIGVDCFWVYTAGDKCFIKTGCMAY